MTDSSIIGIETTSGELLWKYHYQNKYLTHANGPMFSDGKIYCVSGGGKGGVMLQISDDAMSVTSLWQDSILDNKMGGTILYDGKIFGAGSVSKKWVCLDAKTGKEIYSSRITKNETTIYADELLYSYSEGGKIKLIDPKADGYNIVSSFKVPYGNKQHWAHLVINKKRLFVRHGNSLMVYSIVAK